MDHQLIVISSEETIQIIIILLSILYFFSSLVQILHLCQASSSVILRKLALFLTQTGPPLIETTENITLASNIYFCISFLSANKSNKRVHHSLSQTLKTRYNISRRQFVLTIEIILRYMSLSFSMNFP